MIKKILFNVILFFLLFSIVISAFYYYNRIQKEKLSENKIKFVVTVGAIGGLLKEIGGLRVEIINLAKGAHAHEISILPSDLKEIKRAKGIFKIGYGFDDWVDKLSKENKIPLKQIDKNVQLIKRKNIVNPHYWLSVDNLKEISKNIYVTLIETDPDYSWYYFKNYQILMNKLNEIKKYEGKFKNLKNKKIIATHPAVDYLAKEINLQILGYLKTEEGKDLSVKDFYNLVNFVKKENIKTLIAEKGFLTESVRQFAKIYNLNIVEINPLEVMDLEKENIIKVMQNNLEKIYQNIL